MRPPVPELLLISDPAMPGGIVPTLRAALRGGGGARVAVQLRMKGAPTPELLATGRALRALTREAGATLLVNARLDLALALEADGVHLPEDGFATADARSLLGDDRLIGRSCHDRRGLTAAATEGADYATLSPVFPVPGKASPLGLAGFAEGVRGARLPVLALGGVDAASTRDLIDAGAHGVAVVRALGGPSRAEAEARALVSALDRTRPGTR